MGIGHKCPPTIQENGANERTENGANEIGGGNLFLTGLAWRQARVQE